MQRVYSTGNLIKIFKMWGTSTASREVGRANAAAIILGQIMNALALIHTHAAATARLGENGGNCDWLHCGEN